MHFHGKLALGLVAALGLLPLPRAFAQTITTSDAVGVKGCI
jgi:hypothetical protein